MYNRFFLPIVQPNPWINPEECKDKVFVFNLQNGTISRYNLEDRVIEVNSSIVIENEILENTMLKVEHIMESLIVLAKNAERETVYIQLTDYEDKTEHPEVFMLVDSNYIRKVRGEKNGIFFVMLLTGKVYKMHSDNQLIKVEAKIVVTS